MKGLKLYLQASLFVAVAVLYLLTLIQTVKDARKRVFSIDVMKYSQDYVCERWDEVQIGKMVTLVKEAGATHLAVSSPLDAVICPDGRMVNSVNLTKLWVSKARKENLKIWFRMKHSSMEGFYGTPRNLDPQFHILVHQEFIAKNPSLFQSGDIYTVNPEPENAGIEGINCFPSQQCLFKGRDLQETVTSFNQWVVDAVLATQKTFATIGLGKRVRVGYFGFNGFISWGDRNPKWDGILSPQTIFKTGNIVVFDHFFPSETDPKNEYKKIRNHFNNSTALCVGEWGATKGQSADYVEEVLKAAYKNGIRCFNYWQLGPHGIESLTTMEGSNLIPNDYYEVVKNFYTSH